jgi:hypothetical protein
MKDMKKRFLNISLIKALHKHETMQRIASTSTAAQHEEAQIVFRLAHLRLTLRASLIAAAALLLMIGLVAYYTLSSNPVLRSGDALVRWGFLDKRGMLSVYIMSLLFLALIKFMSGICSAPPLLPANGTGVTMERGLWRLFDAPQSCGARGLWFFVGAAIGLALYAEDIFLRIDPDFHLDVHLGSIEAIYQGRIPYVEAQTQYGPGNQLLLYWLMRFLDFSYWGAVEAQHIVNVTIVSLFSGLLTSFFGPIIGMAAIFLLRFFVSPLFIVAFPGWGWLTRWFGVAASSLLLAEILFSKSQRRTLYASLLGAFCGTFAFLSQENFSTGLLAFCLIFGLAGGVRAVNFRESLHLSATLLGSGLLTFGALLTASVGPTHITSAIRLYFDASSKVAAGITNTPWTTPVDRSRLVEAFIYHVSYFLMPGLMLLIALYVPPAQTHVQRQRQKQIIGVLAAAAAAATVTFFRADIFHLYGPSFLLGSLFLSCIVVLPRTLALGAAVRRTLSAGFLVTLACCIIVKIVYGSPGGFGYPVGFANPARSIGRAIAGQWAQPQAPIKLSPSLANVSDPDVAFVLHRMIGNGGARSNQLLTEKYQRIIEIVAQLRKAIGDRRVVFNGTDKYDTLAEWHRDYIPIGLTYFLGGFRVISAVTEPVISIWLMSDYRRWQEDLTNSDVDCLVTTARNAASDPMAMWFISRYPSSTKTTFQVLQKSYLVVCRQ